MKTANHTPTPWEAVGCRIEANKIVYIKSDTSPEGDICDFYHIIDHGENAGKPFLKENAQANAKFIVTACNSHKLLVDACRAGKSILANSIKMINDSREKPVTEQEAISKVYHMFANAIAKAEGK